MEVSTQDCIEWDERLSVAGGYGVFCQDGKDRYAHRVVWEEERGPIPPGMCVCHHCDNPPCINIDHLFLGTIGDNNRDMSINGRGSNQKKTHCPRGHELSGDNIIPYYRKFGRRACRECRRKPNGNS